MAGGINDLLAQFQALIAARGDKQLPISGYEALTPLGRWKALDSLTWDALGEYLVVQFRAGKPDGPELQMSWQIPRDEALALLLLLVQAFEEKGIGEPPKQ